VLDPPRPLRRGRCETRAGVPTDPRPRTGRFDRAACGWPGLWPHTRLPRSWRPGAGGRFRPGGTDPAASPRRRPIPTAGMRTGRTYP